MPFRFGMLGAWHVHADGLVKQLAAYPEEFQLVAVFDPEPEVMAQRQAAWEARCPGVKFIDTPAEVLSHELDGIIVEGRVHDNLRWARLGLESGHPVLLEKPAGTDLEQFRKLTELAHSRRLHLQLIYLFRYMSAMQELMRIARAGELGDLYQFRARLPKVPSEYEHYVADLGRYRGGIFFEMAGHIADLLVTLLGVPSKVHPFLAHHHQAVGDFVDHGLAVCEYPHAYATLEVPALEPVPYQRRVEVYGTRGAAIIPHLGSGHVGNQAIQPIEVWTEKSKTWERRDLPAATLQIADLREFVAVVRGQKQPDFSLEHDLHVQQLLLAASGM